MSMDCIFGYQIPTINSMSKFAPAQKTPTKSTTYSFFTLGMNIHDTHFVEDWWRNDIKYNWFIDKAVSKEKKHGRVQLELIYDNKIQNMVNLL